MHFHRAGGANVLPINGPQVINAVINQTPTQADFRPTQQGYPAGLTDPSRFNPLLANVTYMPEDYHSSRVQSWFISVQRELWDGALVDLAYIGNRADDMLLFANLNQAMPNNSAGTIVAAVAAADFRVWRHHLFVQRRQVALSRIPGQIRLEHRRGFFDFEFADPVADQGQWRRLARKCQRQLSRTAKLLQP